MPFSNKDTWSRDYDSVVELGARIGVKIRERDASGTKNKANSTISKQLKEYQQKLQSLKGALHRLSSNFSISDQEYDRRKNMLDELSTKYQQLEKSHSKGWSTETTYNSTGLDPWEEGGAGPGSAQRMSLDEIRSQQQDIMNKQDEGLEHLSKALRKQTDVGLAIQGEITEHNALIDDIHDATSRTDDKIKFQTRRVNEVRQKDSCKCTCALATVIILLLVAIIVIVAVPYNGKG